MSQNHRKITLARDLRENFWQSGLLSLLGMDLKDMKTIWENLGEAEQVTSQQQYYYQWNQEKGGKKKFELC